MMLHLYMITSMSQFRVFFVLHDPPINLQYDEPCFKYRCVKIHVVTSLHVSV